MKTILMILGSIFVFLFACYLYGDGVIGIFEDLTRHIQKDDNIDDDKEE